MDDVLLKKFLDAIAQNESSGGKNLKHDKTSMGTPGGYWGMKPAEVQTLPQRLKNRNMEVPPNLQDLSKQDYEAITQQLNTNRDVDKEVAGSLAKVLLQDENENLPRAAYKWHRGPSAKVPENSKDMLQKHDQYVQKFVDNFGKPSDEDERQLALLKVMLRNQSAQK